MVNGYYFVSQYPRIPAVDILMRTIRTPEGACTNSIFDECDYVDYEADTNWLQTGYFLHAFRIKRFYVL